MPTPKRPRIPHLIRACYALVYWLVIPAAVIGAGEAADRWLELPSAPSGAWAGICAAVLVAGGMGLIFRAMGDLSRRGRGTPNPHRPPRNLVVDGAYRLCRHPMFLGYDLAALGVLLWTRSLGALLVAYPVFLVLQVLFLRREERELAARFPREHAAYRASVPFLIPRLPHRRNVP